MQSLYLDRRYSLGELRQQEALKRAEHHRLIKAARNGEAANQPVAFSPGATRLYLKVAAVILVLVITLLLIGTTAAATGWIM